MESLLDSIRAFITTDLIGEAAHRLEEPDSAVARALRGLAPTVLAALHQRLTDSGALTALFQQVTANDSAALHHPLAVLDARLAHGSTPYTTAADELLGARLPAVRNAIAAFSGAKPDSVTILLDVALALALGVLTTRVQAGGMNGAGLSNLLLGERDLLYGALPTGVGTILGITDYSRGEDDAETMASNGRSWFVSLIVLLAAGMAIMFAVQGC